MEKFEFRDGDVVNFGGVVGEVTLSESKDYPVKIKNSNGLHLESFTIDGRLYTDHTEPLLKLVSRPKKKVKKTVEVWVNCYSELGFPEGLRGGFVWLSEEQAISAQTGIATPVKFVGEYEVEE